MTYTTGLLYPTAVSQIVTADAAWSEESKAAASDGESATTTLSVLASQSRPLRATGFDFSAIPPNATILGIACHTQVADDGVGATALDSAQLVDGGAAVGDLDPTDLPISVAGGVLTYGGEAALWGLSLTRGHLDGDFGFQITAKRSLGGTVVVSVDSMALEVWYVPMGSWWRTRCRPQRGR